MEKNHDTSISNVVQKRKKLILWSEWRVSSVPLAAAPYFLAKNLDDCPACFPSEDIQDKVFETVFYFWFWETSPTNFPTPTPTQEPQQTQQRTRIISAAIDVTVFGAGLSLLTLTYQKKTKKRLPGIIFSEIFGIL